MFERGQIYYPNLYFFLIGAIVPIPIFFLARRFPNGPWKFINAPIIFSATFNIPPATAIKYSYNSFERLMFSYATWFIVGTVFNFWIKRRNPAWWAKYNCTSQRSDWN